MGAMGEFGDEWPFPRPIPLLCRLFGHKWKRAHILDIDQRGNPIWRYTDDVCTRCWLTEYRLERPESLVESGQTVGDEHGK